MTTPFQGCFLSKSEYRSALRADHGTLRRFLAGCRCPLCDRPAHRRFAKRHALEARARVDNGGTVLERHSG